MHAFRAFVVLFLVVSHCASHMRLSPSRQSPPMTGIIQSHYYCFVTVILLLLFFYRDFTITVTKRGMRF
jgi:hypothetical protein